MKRKKFHLSHSIGGALLLVVVEGLLLHLLGYSAATGCGIILALALFGGIANIIIATEVIEEVRNARRMLLILSAVVAVFVVYFAFQYWFLVTLIPGSFQGLSNSPVDLILHSTMIFVFNPLYLPTNTIARILLLINTFTALALVLFILQNVWQIRGTSPRSSSSA